MPMPPQAAPEQAPPQGGGAPSGGVSKLIDGIHSGLSDLMGIFTNTPGIPDDFKQRLDALGQGFSSLISDMGQEGGGEEPQEASGAAPMEAGVNKNVQPAM